MALPNPHDFIRDPKKFVDSHPEAITPVIELWGRFSKELDIGLRALDENKYAGKSFKEYGPYEHYKVLFSQLYDALEQHTKSNLEAVLAMEIENWKTVDAVPDNDYSQLVQQFFSAVERLNQLIASGGVSGAFAGSLYYQMYGATYELGAKRLVRAAELLKGEEIGEVGTALRSLREAGHTDLVASFDNKLRNGVAHNNYIVNDDSPTTVDYANVWKDRKTGKKTVEPFKISLREIQEKTVDMMWCMMAGMHIHAQRYLEVVKSAISAVS